MNENFIEHAPLFAELAEDEQAALVAGFLEGECAAGAVLFQAGKQGDAIVKASVSSYPTTWGASCRSWKNTWWRSFCYQSE
jgi:hypothetical protein